MEGKLDYMNMTTTYQNSKEKSGDINHGGYGATLLDQRWKAKRKEILDRDNNKCIICMSEENLEIHHRQYHFSDHKQLMNNPWEYSDRYLITLCRRCHQKGHRLYKVTTKTIN